MRFLLWADGPFVSFLFVFFAFCSALMGFQGFAWVGVNGFLFFVSGIICLDGLVVRTLQSGMEEARVRFPVGAFLFSFFGGPYLCFRLFLGRLPYINP